MRLIDADKIRYRDMSDGRVIDGVWYTFMEDIRKQPTVKAISIEWIKNIINANIYLLEQNRERMFVDQGVMKVVNYSITAQILSELIDRWEKENEGNQT